MRTVIPTEARGQGFHRLGVPPEIVQREGDERNRRRRLREAGFALPAGRNAIELAAVKRKERAPFRRRTGRVPVARVPFQRERLLGEHPGFSGHSEVPVGLALFDEAVHNMRQRSTPDPVNRTGQDF